MFDFPSSPPVGRVVTVPDGSFRVWDGVKWRAAPSAGAINLDIQDPSSNFAVVAAGTDQASATPVKESYCVVITGTYGAGIMVMPRPPWYQRVVNTCGVPINVFPEPGKHFTGFPDDAPYEMGNTQSAFFALTTLGVEVVVSS